jgi:hypothetical protein
MIGNRLDRLRRISRDELQWRARVAARTAAHRFATRFSPPRWNRLDLRHALAEGVVDDATRANAMENDDWPAVHAALAGVLKGRNSRFVLAPASRDELRGDVLSRWPSAASLADFRAERILAGQYDLLGYRGLAFRRTGRDVDWHLDPVHNRRAPRVFWADVPFLDPATGDHKIVWELNRHQHWLQLGRALWLTGDVRYGRAIVDQLESWLRANPPLLGINWASMLELGFRAMSWTWALHCLLADDRVMSDKRPWLVDMLVGLDRQLTHIEQNLSYYFSPNTHLTGEALALYVVGLALPELAASSRWVEKGRRILLAEIDRQIFDDGGHVERSTHYQRYTLDFYLMALLAAERAQDVGAIPRLTDAVTRLAEFTRAMADDRGCLPLIGDDDGGMLWPIAGRECHDVRDSLALAAVVLRRPELAPWGVPEEVFWIAGDLARSGEPAEEGPGASDVGAGFPGLSAVEGCRLTRSRAFLDTGYFVARDGSGGHAVFDVGAHGYLNGGHAHADALAITLSVERRPLLIDPGTSTYTMNARLRDRMRSSQGHNTVTLDERPQSIPSGPFGWQTRADGRLHAYRHNPWFDWAEASHDGYAPVQHRRSLLRTADMGWLVVDEILGHGRHSATAHWHFDPSWMLTSDVPGRLRAAHSEGDMAWLLHDGDGAWLVHGDEKSGLGWCAPAYGTLVPTWTARIRRDGIAPFALVTWFGASSPAVDGPPSLVRVPVACDPGGAAIAARVIAGTRSSVFLLRPGEPTSRDSRGCGVLDYQTNARVLHYVTNDDQLLAVDVIDASHALALREGWLSLAADAPIADLHAAIDHGVLDLRASNPPAQLRVQGGAVTGLRVVRVNGRELPPPSTGRSDTLVIHGGLWAEQVKGQRSFASGLSSLVFGPD